MNKHTTLTTNFQNVMDFQRNINIKSNISKHMMPIPTKQSPTYFGGFN
jgi:hypothetical protein